MLQESESSASGFTSESCYFGSPDHEGKLLVMDLRDRTSGSCSYLIEKLEKNDWTEALPVSQEPDEVEEVVIRTLRQLGYQLLPKGKADCSKDKPQEEERQPPALLLVSPKVFAQYARVVHVLSLLRHQRGRMRLLRWVQPSPKVCTVHAGASPDLHELGAPVDVYTRLVIMLRRGLGLPLQLSHRR